MISPLEPSPPTESPAAPQTAPPRSASRRGSALAAGALGGLLCLSGCSADADPEPGPVGGADLDDDVTPDLEEPPADSDPDDTLDAPVFSAAPLTFTAEVGTTEGVCYDFDTNAAVDCAAAAGTWDLFFNVTGQSYNIWTNGGIHGAGDGAAFGPSTPDQIGAIESSSDVPGWFRDSLGGIFASFPWQTYNVYGTHDITANQRVYLVKTSAATYRVQILSYYDGAGTSGMPKVRFAPLGDDSAIQELVIDARAGGFGAAADDPANKFTYLDLDAAEILEDLDDATARTSNLTWDLGFKRYEVIVNGGASGPGGASSAIADEMGDLYDEDGAPIVAKFSELSDETALDAFNAVVDESAATFVLDAANPYIINDGGDDSWYTATYDPMSGPQFSARPEVWWVVRGGEGDSFAKCHVTAVEYPARHFTVELFVQERADE